MRLGKPPSQRGQKGYKGQKLNDQRASLFATHFVAAKVDSFFALF